MNKNILRRFAQILVSLVIQWLCIFISAGTLEWQWPWILLALSIMILIINGFLLPPELIEERGKKKEDAKGWDKVLTKIGIIPWLGVPVIAGLDYRFAWSGHLHVCIYIAGLILYFASSMFATWSMVSNKFFSTMVRIQIDRDHHVASRGPYRFIRHPGYLGFILMMTAMPLALGSLYALTMSACSAILFIVRTAMEDATLKMELQGYADYAKKVRYRLVPYIW